MSAHGPRSARGRSRRVSRVVLGVVALAQTACGPATHAPPADLTDISGLEPELRLPNSPDSFRFAVIGDSGTGTRSQYEIGSMMTAYHDAFEFELVLMLGDNMYGSEGPPDYELKFERPYAALLERGVDFYASLGNHDERAQRLYEPFNMGGELYYTFAVDDHDVRFFALYSDYLDPAQLEWLQQELSSSDEAWKIAFFHHPLYSSGGFHGPDMELRAALEPLFVQYGVDLVLTGHEHFYERFEPQQGIVHIVNGAAAKLRPGDIRTGRDTASGFDQEHSFLLMELAGDTLWLQAVSRSGAVVDYATLRHRGPAPGEVASGTGAPERSPRP